MRGSVLQALATGIADIERFAEVVAAVEQLAGGNPERIVFTLGALAVVVGVRLLTGWMKRGDVELSSKRRLLLSTTVAATTALAVLAVLAIWGLGDALVVALENAAIADHLSNIVLAVVLLASAYAVTDFLGGVIRELATESTAVSEHQEEMLRRTVQLSVYTLVVLVTVGLFTDNVGSLLVGAGFLGIVVGMAARQTLGAVLAGFVLMFSRPFEVGDWVEVGEHEGTVTEISIINTRMRSFDGEVVTIPNDEVRATAVIDRSRRNRLRIEIEVGVDYEADVDRAAEIVRHAVAGVDDVARMPEPNVVTKRFADSAILLGVRYWITDPSMRKRWRTQTAAMGAIKTGLEEEGITIPFPQQTLSARSADSDELLDSRAGRGRIGGGGQVGDGSQVDGGSQVGERSARGDGSRGDGSGGDGSVDDGSGGDGSGGEGSVDDGTDGDGRDGARRGSGGDAR